MEKRGESNQRDGRRGRIIRKITETENVQAFHTGQADGAKDTFGVIKGLGPVFAGFGYFW